MIIHGNSTIIPTQTSTFIQSETKTQVSGRPRDISSTQSTNIVSHTLINLNPALMSTGQK